MADGRRVESRIAALTLATLMTGPDLQYEPFVRTGEIVGTKDIRESMAPELREKVDRCIDAYWEMKPEVRRIIIG